MPDQLRFYVYKQTLKHNDVLVGKLKSGLIEIFNRDFDVGGEGNEFYDDDDDDELVVAQTVNIRIPGLRSMPLLVGAHYQTRRWPTKQSWIIINCILILCHTIVQYKLPIKAAKQAVLGH